MVNELSSEDGYFVSISAKNWETVEMDERPFSGIYLVENIHITETSSASGNCFFFSKEYGRDENHVSSETLHKEGVPPVLRIVVINTWLWVQIPLGA